MRTILQYTSLLLVLAVSFSVSASCGYIDAAGNYINTCAGVTPITGSVPANTPPITVITQPTIVVETCPQAVLYSYVNASNQLEIPKICVKGDPNTCYYNVTIQFQAWQFYGGVGPYSSATNGVVCTTAAQ